MPYSKEEKERAIRKINKAIKEINKTLYHCTKKENLKNILEHGLIPKKPEKIRNPNKGVYLSIHPFDWMHYVTCETTVAGAMIEVDVEGLEIHLDESIHSSSLESNPAYYVKEKIPPSRFVNIFVSNDEEPASFEKFGAEKINKLKKIVR